MARAAGAQERSRTRSLRAHRAHPLRRRGDGAAGRGGEVLAWAEGREPVLEVEKRGRFITNMAFADFGRRAVESGDPRIKGSFLVILEPETRAWFDRGAARRAKLVHQLSSTTTRSSACACPRPYRGRLRVRDGVIARAQITPRSSRPFPADAGDRRLMTSAKLLVVGRPILRYQRVRFRGVETTAPGTPRYELACSSARRAHRLLDVWASGEASASWGLPPRGCSTSSTRGAAGRRHPRRRGADGPAQAGSYARPR